MKRTKAAAVHPQEAGSAGGAAATAYRGTVSDRGSASVAALVLPPVLRADRERDGGGTTEGLRRDYVPKTKIPDAKRHRGAEFIFRTVPPVFFTLLAYKTGGRAVPGRA